MSDLESSSRIEERSVIKFLVEQCKLREIFKRMSAVYEEAYFSQKHVYRRTKLFKKEEKMLLIKTSQEDL